jgi:dTDP-4-dehydrorhamnose 3,5-epimerase
VKVISTSLKDVLLIEPTVFEDKRGFFMETYQKKIYRELGIESDFIQDNLSFSVRGTLRGLHYQLPHAQAKLVQVITGEIFDVTVDIRKGSPTFGQWTGSHLSDKNKRQVYIPEGFAHGFCVLSETAIFTYKCSDFYSPDSERGVLWSDPVIGVDWPVENPVLSKKDHNLNYLKDILTDYLPTYEKIK